MSDQTRHEVALALGFDDWESYLEWWTEEMKRHDASPGPKTLVTIGPRNWFYDRFLGKLVASTPLHWSPLQSRRTA